MINSSINEDIFQIFFFLRMLSQLTGWVPVRTVVGELHSLTDWHVSEASDDAELDDFYNR